MFEDLYENSVKYDDNLLQAACVVQAEFDLTDTRDYAIICRSKAFREMVKSVAQEYGVKASDVKARLKEILEDA